MKKFPRLLALGLFCLVLVAFAPGTGNTQSASISKKGFFYNKLKISADWSLSPLLAELGEPDSVFVGYNKLHIYKKKGIVVFEKMNGKSPSGMISEVQFFIDRTIDDNTYKLKDNYTGSIKAGKLKLEPGLSSEMAKSKLKKWGLTDSYTPNSYRFANYGVYMYLLFNEAETRLTKVSIGKDSKK